MKIKNFLFGNAYPEALSMRLDEFTGENAEFLMPKGQALMKKSEELLSYVEQLEGDCAKGLFKAINDTMLHLYSNILDIYDEAIFRGPAYIEIPIHRCHELAWLIGDLIGHVKLSNINTKIYFNDFRNDFDRLSKTISVIMMRFYHPEYEIEVEKNAA